MRPFIDVHCHIGATINRAPAVGQSIGKCLGRMASGGVAAAIASPTAGGPQAEGVLDTRKQNQEIATACRRFPDRFPIGLGYAEVRHLQAGVDELERSMTEDGLLGFQIHPSLSGHGFSAVAHPFLEVVAMAGGLVLLHADAAGPEMAAYAKRFPSLSFICGNPFGHGHSGADRDHSGLPAGVTIPENIWFDIAQYRSPEDPDASRQLHRMVEFVGSDRILFGSDLPYADFRFVQQEIEKSRLSEEEKDKIAFKNATRLIQQFKPDWTLPELPFDPPQHYTDQELWTTQESKGSPPGYRLA